MGKEKLPKSIKIMNDNFDQNKKRFQEFSVDLSTPASLMYNKHVEDVKIRLYSIKANGIFIISP